ncbi:MAG: hypothetical protein Pyrs2KO_15420 [Pyruvatibacter sp.]
MKRAVLDKPRTVKFRRAIASGALFSGKAPNGAAPTRIPNKYNEDIYSNPLKY